MTTDSQIIAAIQAHGADHTVNTLGRMIGVGANRLERVAYQHGLQLRKPRKSVNEKTLRMKDVNGYWIKLCPSCEEWKGVEFFNSDETRLSGFHSYCRACENGRRRIRDALKRLKERGA